MGIAIQISFIFLLLIFLSNASTPGGTNIRSAFDLYDKLLTNYSKDIRPVHNENEKLIVNLTAILYSVVSLDEVSGELVVNLGFYMKWFDVSLTWNLHEYENRTRMEIDVTRIWRPALQLYSPIQMSTRLGKEEDKAVVNNQGLVSLFINDIFQTICFVDIYHFPFDKQICDIWFGMKEYPNLLSIVPTASTMDTSVIFENSNWKIESTGLYSLQFNSHDNLICRILLKRRPAFYVLTMLAPLLTLMLLNSVVFLLPAECGERVGFSVTLLLSTAVYMTIISDKLPSSSEPCPVLAYALLAYIAQSSFICIETMVGLRIYFNDDEKPIPPALSHVVSCLVCPCSSLPKGNPTVEKDDTISMNDQNPKGRNKNNTGSGVTWKLFAEVFDKILFFINVSLTIIVAIVYFLIVL